MPLTEEEKGAIRHHCGFLQVADVYTFVLGSPASVETQYLIEGAMMRVLESALPRVRQILGRLESLEAEMDESSELDDVNRIGDIEINQDNQKKRIVRYDRHVAELCNLLGVERNPFDKRLLRNGVNIPVSF